VRPVGGSVVVDLEAEGVRHRHRVRRAADPRGEVVHHVNGPTGQSSLTELSRYPGAEGEAAEGAIMAPMPGRVIRIVEEGAEVGAGEVVAVLEAMKMEHELTAPAAGTVAEARVSEGQQVEAGTVLAVLAEPEALPGPS
jgi:propionyl-CoA carboxylase alpha chain